MLSSSRSWPAPASQSARWRRWVTAWTILSAPAAFVGSVMWGPGAIARLILVVMFLVGPVYLVAAAARDQSGDADRARSAPSEGQPNLSTVERGRGAVRTAFLAAMVVVAAGVCGLASDVAALSYLLLVGSTSPVARDLGSLGGQRLEERFVKDEQSSSPEAASYDRSSLRTVELKPPGIPDPDMSTEALCALWRRSFTALRDARTPDEVARAVAARQRCLDEMERRDPEMLRAWLSTVPCAAGGSDTPLGRAGQPARPRILHRREPTTTSSTDKKARS